MANGFTPGTPSSRSTREEILLAPKAIEHFATGSDADSVSIRAVNKSPKRGDAAAPSLGLGRGLNIGESQRTQIHHLVTIAEFVLPLHGDTKQAPFAGE